MKIFVSALLYMLIVVQVKSQESDSLLFSHYTVVKDAKGILLPRLNDPKFCNDLSLIKIPDSLKLMDGDEESFYYHLSFEVCFKKNGKVASVKIRRNLESLQKINSDVVKRLLASKWEITKSSKKRRFYFECNIQDNILKNVTLRSLDNSQNETICK